MQLILFRHGLAWEREEWKGNERDRPLTNKGVTRVRQAGKGLLAMDALPTHLFSSPLRRAQETADLLQRLFRPKPTLQLCEALQPAAPPKELLGLLRPLPATSLVLCVGHEPHLSRLAGLLLFGRSGAGLSLKKAGACSIEINGTVRPGSGTLVWWLTAAQLRALG